MLEYPDKQFLHDRQVQLRPNAPAEARKEAVVLLRRTNPNIFQHLDEMEGCDMTDQLDFEIDLMDNDLRDPQSRIGESRYALLVVMTFKNVTDETWHSKLGDHSREVYEKVEFDEAITNAILQKMDRFNRGAIAECLLPEALLLAQDYLETNHLWGEIGGLRKQVQDLKNNLESQEYKCL